MVFIPQFIPQPVQCGIPLAFGLKDPLLKTCYFFAQGKFSCVSFPVNVIKDLRPYFPDTDCLRMGPAKLIFQLTDPGILFTESSFKLLLHLHKLF